MRFKSASAVPTILEAMRIQEPRTFIPFTTLWDLHAPPVERVQSYLNALR